MYNPKVKDFLEANKDVSIIGLYWAGYWRLALCIFGGYMVLFVIASIMAGMTF